VKEPEAGFAPGEENLTPDEAVLLMRLVKVAAAIQVHCQRCGRPLSDELSVRRGYGPDCWAKGDHDV
jgi:hypothetical protein